MDSFAGAGDPFGAKVEDPFAGFGLPSVQPPPPPPPLSQQQQVEPVISTAFPGTTASSANIDFFGHTDNLSPSPPVAQRKSTSSAEFDPIRAASYSNTAASGAAFSFAKPPDSFQNSFDPFSAPSATGFEVPAVAPSSSTQSASNLSFDPFDSDAFAAGNKPKNEDAAFGDPATFVAAVSISEKPPAFDEVPAEHASSAPNLDIFGNPISSIVTDVPETGVAFSSSIESDMNSKIGGNGNKPSGVGDEGEIEAQLEIQSGGDKYEVIFPTEIKLGMLLERFDEKDPVSGQNIRERTLVKMIIEGGAADRRGVKVGSKVVSINDTMVVDQSYLETLNMVKTEPRPLKIILEQVGSYADASQGTCFIRKDMSYSAPSSKSLWLQRYFVIGGAVAKPNVLQVNC